MRCKGIVEILQKEGSYATTTNGISMWPMLRHRSDTVIIEPVNSQIKRLDVVLYQNNPDSCVFVLHRVIGETTTQWIIRGDNLTHKEWIDKSRILGKMTGFYRGNHYIPVTSWKFRCYSGLWCNTPVVKYPSIFCVRCYITIKRWFRRYTK